MVVTVVVVRVEESVFRFRYLFSRVTLLDTMMPTSAVTGPEFRKREI